MSLDTEYEIELDPAGYSPRPDLFARNLTRQPVSFNLGRVRWLLGAKGNIDDEQPLPWTVARSSGFRRVWDRGEVLVALDPEFTEPITELPPVGLYRPYVHVQNTPQAVTTIVHGHGRTGPVQVALYSLDGLIEYDGFITESIDKDTCRVSTDDPLTFIATVF